MLLLEARQEPSRRDALEVLIEAALTASPLGSDGATAKRPCVQASQSGSNAQILTHRTALQRGYSLRVALQNVARIAAQKNYFQKSFRDASTITTKPALIASGSVSQASATDCKSVGIT